ncbi:hypothetical protein FRB95_007528 [Tulasnella sp. JGI-2019a]|nr:hypothetical protein FRB95_007528 [Tulasnella sp. JGI-2019a]
MALATEEMEVPQAMVAPLTAGAMEEMVALAEPVVPLMAQDTAAKAEPAVTVEPAKIVEQVASRCPSG